MKITLDEKKQLLADILTQLEMTRKIMAEAAAESASGATHPESRAEDPKDMRSTEVSYLARGQAMRVEELDEQITRLRYFEPSTFGEGDSVAAGALVELEDEDMDEPRTVFFLPYGGGVEVRRGERTVTVVTGTSPLGRSLLGKSIGDEVDFVVRGKKRELVVLSIA